MRVMREDGYSLMEVLVALTTGTIVLLGLFKIMEVALPASTRVQDRVEAQARARSALEQVLQQLRSVVCVPASGGGYVSPFVSADGSQVTFYADIVPGPTSAANDPGRNAAFNGAKHVLQFSGGQLTEKVYNYSPGPPPSWPASPSTQRTLLANVAPVNPGAPYFTYSAYNAAQSLSNPPQALAAGTVAAADLPRIVSVDVAFKNSPRGISPTGSDHSTTLKGSATIGLPLDFTDATTAAKGPTCQF
jgi:hypothetical protein